MGCCMYTYKILYKTVIYGFSNSNGQPASTRITEIEATQQRGPEQCPDPHCEWLSYRLSRRRGSSGASSTGASLPYFRSTRAQRLKLAGW